MYETFGIDPSTIQLVEAHGTGTKLGDPIEFQALTRAFRRYTAKRQYCAIGSIKTNLGHTSMAAGVAGVIKVLLSMRHGQIPASLHFERGNSHIDFDNSPFYVNTQLRDQGIRFLSDPGESLDALAPEDVVILPAFGTTVELLEDLVGRGCTLVDTTCGSVLNVWKNVKRYAEDGFTSVIHGKYWHEETRATASQTLNAGGGAYLVVLDRDEAARGASRRAGDQHRVSDRRRPAPRALR